MKPRDVLRPGREEEIVYNHPSFSCFTWLLDEEEKTVMSSSNISSIQFYLYGAKS